MVGDKRLSKVTGFTLFLMFVLSTFALAEMHLQYQDRGGRYEGIKPKPVSGYDIELISVVVDYKDEVRRMPDRFKVKFFLQPPLKDPSKVYLTVRELDYKYYYWLDKVQPPPNSWRPGFDNVFEWPTQDVIQQLDDIKMYDLGVVIRLDKSIPSWSERVAPAILYHYQFPVTIKGYKFTFKTNSDAHLKCSVYKEKELVFTQVFPKKRGGRPFVVRWDSSNAVEGSYSLVVKGFFLDTNDPIDQIVNFYHQPVVK